MEGRGTPTCDLSAAAMEGRGTPTCDLSAAAMEGRGDTADEELQVCTKCCAQFEDQEDFVQHRDRCPVNTPVVVIVGNQEDGSSAPLQGGKPPEPGPPFSSLGTQCPPGLIAGTPEMQGPRLGAAPANGDGKSSGVAGYPGIGTSRSPWSDPRNKEAGSSQPFLMPSGGLNLEGVQSPKIGMAPHDAPPGGAPPSTPLNIPMILEELRVLQQRQIHQMQMTEQICRQVLMLGSMAQPTVPVAAGGGPSPTSPGAGTKTVPIFSAVKLNQVPETPKTVPGAEAPKQAFFQLYNPMGNLFSERSLPSMPSLKPKSLVPYDEKPVHGPASLPTSPPSQLLSAHAAFPTGILAPQVGMFLGARVLETVPSLLKQKNGEPTYVETLQEKSSGRHKCRFCAKVFGSDSALQIHLRSHTGERPYKCNICGNRFTTRGNLKVHFQRHKDKYPHIQMNPHPVPEHLDYMLNGNGLPYGMSVPPEKSDEEPVEKKPLLSALSATESLTLLSSAQTLPSFNKFLLMKTGENSAPLKSANVGMKSKADENTPPADRETPADNSGRMQLSKLATSLPSWALLTNHFKASTFPFPYVVDPLGSSETFKLQQLVEKIDKQAASPNQCIICLRVLSCPRALRLHYSQHGGERPFKCKICGRAFSTKGNLKAHFVGHKSSPAAKAQNSCPICQKKFTNAVTLQQHIRMHLGGQIPNGVLPEGVGTKLSCLDETFPEQDFSEEDITDEDSLEASGSESEKVGQMDSEISSLGEEATVSFSKEDMMDLSMAHSLPPTLPAHPGPSLDFPPEVRLQVEPCIDLQDRFRSNELTNIDVPTVQQDEGPQAKAAEPMGESPEYESTTLSPEPLGTAHEGGIGPEETLEGDGPGETLEQDGPGETLEEVISGETLEEVISGETLEEVIPGETLEEVIPGERLEKVLPEETSEVASPGETSVEVGGHACNICSALFLSLDSLAEHVQGHRNDGLFLCTVCKQRFLEKSSLRSHMLLNHPVGGPSPPMLSRPQAVGLPTLGQALVTPLPAQAPSELRAKTEVVSLPPMVTFLRVLPSSSVLSLPFGSSPRQYLCPVCLKAFSSASALQIHERIHTEEKPYSCTMCERAFTTQGNMKVHMSTHVWDSNPARAGRPLTVEPPAPPLFSGVAVQTAAPNVPAGDDPVQLATSGPLSFWNQYTAFLARSSKPGTEIPTAGPESPAGEGSPPPSSTPVEFLEKIPPSTEATIPISPAAEEK